jgi:hypothetical protein
MCIRRALYLMSVCATLSACRSQPSTAPRTVAYKPAPKATIHATMTGTGMSRQVSAAFAAEDNAFVVVGHVGGDGRLRILFPDNARQSGFISRHQQYQIPAFAADVDANPSLYSLTRPPMRTAGARMDSYDGAGSAFVFIISSGEPFTFDDLALDDGSFGSYLLPSYWYEPDPRADIEQFARDLADGKPYRLQYAFGFNTTRYASLTDRLFECARLEEAAGVGGYGRPWIWGWFGNDINFWDVVDLYAGMQGCNRARWFPGVYAFGVPKITPKPPTTPKHYAGLRVLHLPLVSSQPVSRDDDGRIPGSQSSDQTRITDYLARRTPGSGNTGTSGFLPTNGGTTTNVGTTTLRQVTPTVTTSPTTTVISIPTRTIERPYSPPMEPHRVTTSAPPSPPVITRSAPATTTTTAPATTTSHDAPRQPPPKPQKS